MTRDQAQELRVGIDLSAPYLDQALRRCKDAPLPFDQDVLTMGDPT